MIHPMHGNSSLWKIKSAFSESCLPYRHYMQPKAIHLMIVTKTKLTFLIIINYFRYGNNVLVLKYFSLPKVILLIWCDARVEMLLKSDLYLNIMTC